MRRNEANLNEKKSKRSTIIEEYFFSRYIETGNYIQREKNIYLLMLIHKVS
jgi:hypothetical protein